MNVVIKSPPKVGNHAVTATANPSIINETIAKICSRITHRTTITATAKKPGISLTL